MKKIEEILKNRKNVSFFREDKIPDKKIIENLLEKTHNLTPHKNNFYHFVLNRSFCKKLNKGNHFKRIII